jgi:hypothetical protein
MGIFSIFSSKKDRAFSQAGNFTSQSCAPSVSAMDTQTYLASDDKEWLRYLSQPLRTYRKPGLSMKDEHTLWMNARAQARAMAASSQRPLNA